MAVLQLTITNDRFTGTHPYQRQAIVVSSTQWLAYSTTTIRLQRLHLNDSGTVNVINNFENTADAFIILWWRKHFVSLAAGIQNRRKFTRNNEILPSFGGKLSRLKEIVFNIHVFIIVYLSNPEIRFKWRSLKRLNSGYYIYVEYSTNFGQSWQSIRRSNPELVQWW
jgi:hypothetical protein